MARAAIKHYRVAQKEVEKKDGIVIPRNYEHKYAMFAAAALFLVFVDGLVIGYLAGRRR